jgi:hypothetical protein
MIVTQCDHNLRIAGFPTADSIDIARYAASSLKHSIIPSASSRWYAVSSRSTARSPYVISDLLPSVPAMRHTIGRQSGLA